MIRRSLYHISILVPFAAYGMQSPDTSLAQRVAALHTTFSRMKTHTILERDFSDEHESLCALRRSLHKAEGSSRLLASCDSLVAYADNELAAAGVEYKSRNSASSVSAADKIILSRAHIIQAYRALQSLFEGLSCNGRYYGDESRVATCTHVKIDADGQLLALIEALECFSRATDDDRLLCSSCKSCPQEMWCSDCKQLDSGHSRITPYLKMAAQESKKFIGVHDAAWYLHSRMGSLADACEKYIHDDQQASWQGDVRLKNYAELRKSLVQLAKVHKVIIDALSTMSDEQLSVKTGLAFLENAPGSIGLAESAVKNTRSYNPLKFVPAKLFCVAALGDVAQKLDSASKDLPEGVSLADIAKIVREATKNTLGITEKDVPALCQLLRIFSLPIDSALNEGAYVLRESAADLARFAELYQRPMREQLLSPELREHFKMLAHAWKTQGIDRSALRLVGAPKPKEEQEK